jgi:hypothetical protein
MAARTLATESVRNRDPWIGPSNKELRHARPRPHVDRHLLPLAGHPVSAVVHLPVEHGISGIPVTNADGVLLGMVTEGDLLGRAALSDEPRHGWFQPHWIVAVALRGPRSPRLAGP